MANPVFLEGIRQILPKAPFVSNCHSILRYRRKSSSHYTRAKLLTALYADLLYYVSEKPDNKHENYGQEFITLINKLQISLRCFHKIHICSKTFCKGTLQCTA